MQPNSTEINTSDLALCRGGLYEALALGFRPPTRETVQRLCTDEQNQALFDLAAVLEDGGSKSLQAAILSLRNCSDISSIESLQASFRYLFGHTAHPTAPPYETEYGSDTLFQQPQQLGDLSGFYNAFGLQLNGEGRERADHVSCECEFLAFLNMKEAYAIEQNDQEMLEETQKAQKLFLKDHLARFAPSFANLLTREHSKNFYGVLGKLLREFVMQECVRFNVPSGPESLQLRPKTTVDECFTCGAGDQLIQEISDQAEN